MKKKFNILAACILLLSNILMAENRQYTIDSLLKCLPSASKSGKANIYNQLRKEYIFQGSNYTKALEYSFQSIKIYEELKRDSDVFIMNGNIANIYFLQKDYKSSIEYLYKANKYNSNDDYICYMYSVVYENIGKYDSSLFYAKKCIRLSNDTSRIAYSMQAIGTVYEKLNMLDSSIFWYSKSIDLCKKIKNDSGISEGFASLGDVYLIKKFFQKALLYEKKSLLISISEDDLPSICQTEKKISEIYGLIGQCQLSYLHFKKYIEVKDSLINKNRIVQTVRIEDNFKFEKEKELSKMEQNKKDEIKQNELKNQRNQRNIFICGFILFLIFSIFIFNRWRVTIRQKVIIENQKKIVDEKKIELEDQKKSAMENIRYAKKIQDAILPSGEYMKSLSNNFLIYRGRDIVSGDVYWAYKDDNGNVYYAVGDCTSHGSSAAMLTMIVSSLLNEIIIKRNITQPDRVLNVLREDIIKALNKEGASEERMEGCDLAFIKINGMKLECASANTPIYIVRNNVLLEIKSNRFPIGKYIDDIKPFTLNTFDLSNNDVLYIASDGAKDQFSGVTNKKLMAKKFKEWLLEISKFPMEIAKENLNNLLDNWIKGAEQTDDITILSVKINE